MYDSVKSCVKYNGNTSQYFTAGRGLRQGENLSPILFSLYLNDIEAFFVGNGNPTLSFIEKLNSDCDHDLDTLLNLFIILYADDTVILAEDENSLQSQLDTLYAYCLENDLTVNIDKTKVLIFARSKCRIKIDTKFMFGTDEIEIVEDYLYLGVKFNWNGSFAKAKKYLYDKAMRAMFSVIQKGRRLKLPIDVLLKLFDMCVAPVALYGCEIWGFESLDLLESLHCTFCKIIMKVSKYSHNLQVLAELGRYPMSIEVKRRMVNFWLKTVTGKDSKLNAILYRISLNLYVREKHKSPWLLYIKKIFDDIGLSYIWLQQYTENYKTLSKYVKQVLRDQHVQEMLQKVNDDQQYVNFKLYKNDVRLEKYITQLDGSLVHSLFEFRIGSYLLPVNNRSNAHIDRSERLCPACNTVGDELHFIYDCTLLSDLRDNSIHLSMSRNLEILRNPTPQLAKFIRLGLSLYKSLQ
ncbi:uncharacterized protein LOC141903501 [Tubulanus polymorphus]|uniref:uncharacterized protein LOC141903501 n=1 Tax=Tubulanus polymorphus TaxID=672921 RepID=UPI003DA679F1